MKVGLVIREIREFNIQSGGFESDFFLSLTADKEMPNLNLVFTNGHEVNMASLVDTPTFKVYSVTGKFTTDVDLRKYPYDTQNLFLMLELAYNLSSFQLLAGVVEVNRLQDIMPIEIKKQISAIYAYSMQEAVVSDTLELA